MDTNKFKIGDYVLFKPIESKTNETFIARVYNTGDMILGIMAFGNKNRTVLRSELKKFKPSRFEKLILDELL